MSEFSNQVNVRILPSPSVPTYYWYRPTPIAKEIPVFVEPATNGYPATALINGRNVDVSQLSGTFRASNYLDNYDEFTDENVLVARQHFTAGAIAMLGGVMDDRVKRAAEQYLAQWQTNTLKDQRR